MDSADSATRLWGPLSLISRIFLAAIFLVSGFSKIGNWGATISYMQAQGLPGTAFLLLCATAIEVLGGLFLLFGLRARATSAILFLYLIPTTLVFHRFWNMTGTPEAQNQFIHFLKNLSIMGGLLHVTALGAGRWSLDFRQKRELFVPEPAARPVETEIRERRAA